MGQPGAVRRPVAALGGHPAAAPGAHFPLALAPAGLPPSTEEGRVATTLGKRPASGDESLGAAARQAAHLAPPGVQLQVPTQPPMPTLVASPSAPGVAAPASLEEILPALVRKIAWSGDARRGAVRIELGAGALAGATLLVAADGGRVQVTLSGGADAELDPWRERIVARLAARGLDADMT